MKRQHLLEFFSHNAIKNKIEIYDSSQYRSQITVHRSLTQEGVLVIRPD